MNFNSENFNYYTILSKEIPNFLLEYLDIPELKRIGMVGMNCGTDYTKLFHNRCFYSRLDHSIGVALIIWKFTYDKSQTIAGLLHDIATPSFSHCIDYMHKDYIKQESTEAKTKEIICSSQQLLRQLHKDHIAVENVVDYKKYSIADNPSPQLSADRLEYTLSSGMIFSHTWEIKEINRIYSDIDVFVNEDGKQELGFRTLEIAEEFVQGASRMWYMFQENRDKLAMQFWADIICTLINNHIINEESLYRLSEDEIVKVIQKCGIDEIKETFAKFQEAVYVCEGDEKPNKAYVVNICTKKRYINPLVCGKRATELSEVIRGILNEFNLYRVPKYCWFGFDMPKNLFI